MEIITQSPAETAAVGRTIADYIKKRRLKDTSIVLLSGELGSGKTEMVKGLAAGLGVTRRIISPTFTLIRHYDLGAANFYHIDLYRLRGQLSGLDLETLMHEPGAVLAIEWPETLDKFVPSGTLRIKIEIRDINRRKITLNRDIGGNYG